LDQFLREHVHDVDRPGEYPVSGSCAWLVGNFADLVAMIL
jgi:hypothetical protein